MSEYIKAVFTLNDPERKDLLLVRLIELGFDGFEEERMRLIGYISSEAFDKSGIQELARSERIQVTTEEVGETNWNAEWERNFSPVVVDGFCQIRAAFHAPTEGIRHDIVITPKMSFGTGHHATTWMMVKAMEHLQLQGSRVLDFGTGTGILAILAEKMGAAWIEAIDNDDWSIDNAIENVAANGCSRITVAKADSLAFSEPFDIILANINRNVILAELDNIRQHLSPGGVVLLSGLLEADQPVVMQKAATARFSLKTNQTRDGWIRLELNGH